jgi:hypothetical protein
VANINAPALPVAYQVFPPSASTPYLLDGGAYDGTGFKSTGLVGSIPPAVVSYKLTFTKAGTYHFQCLFHQDMKGTIRVS